MKELVYLLIGLCSGTLGSFFLLRFLLPPIISRALEVRGRYKKIKEEDAENEMKDIKEKLKSEVNEDDRKKIIADVADYFDTYYPDGFPGGQA